jgi:hypothetical protein
VHRRSWGKGSQVVSIDEGKGREGAAYELSPASGEGQKSLPAGAYMGSKNGTKYYAPWCASAQRIKPENIVWFESENDALSKGYSKTTSCSF